MECHPRCHGSGTHLVSCILLFATAISQHIQFMLCRTSHFLGLAVGWCLPLLEIVPCDSSRWPVDNVLAAPIVCHQTGTLRNVNVDFTPFLLVGPRCCARCSTTCTGLSECCMCKTTLLSSLPPLSCLSNTSLSTCECARHELRSPQAKGYIFAAYRSNQHQHWLFSTESRLLIFATASPCGLCRR